MDCRGFRIQLQNIAPDGENSPFAASHSWWNAMVEALAEKERIEESLRTARAEVKQGEGIIPICMYCKKIRNDKDYWEKLENYLTEHSEALFSHGICPECLEKNFGKKK